MSEPPEPPEPPEPVGPSLVVRLLMGPMTKALNPVMGRLAGRRRFGAFAEIQHVGRRSGRTYRTTTGARVDGDLVVVPLTFGNRSDWSRNVRAAGGCSARVAGRDYDLVRPEYLTAHQARPLLRATFGVLERVSFRVLGIRQFMRLEIVRVREPAEHADGEGGLAPPVTPPDPAGR